MGKEQIILIVLPQPFSAGKKGIASFVRNALGEVRLKSVHQAEKTASYSCVSLRSRLILSRHHGGYPL